MAREIPQIHLYGKIGNNSNIRRELRNAERANKDNPQQPENFKVAAYHVDDALDREHRIDAVAAQIISGTRNLDNEFGN